MKKILCLSPYRILPAETGGQKSIVSFYKALSESFRIICISTRDNDSTKAEGFELRNILSNSALRYINPFYFFAIRKIIRKERPDYLQIEHPYLGGLATLLKKFTGVRLIVRSHNIEGIRFKNLGKWWWKLLLSYEGWVHRQADINFFISDFDKAYAIKAFALSSLNAYTITFGISLTHAPSQKEYEGARNFLINEYKLDGKEVILLFNGAFDYSPNLNALSNLVNYIFPILRTTSKEKFKLMVCGKNIPEDLVRNNTNSDIIYAGFVSDINTYLTGATIFVNPVTEGGGIKTKLVEALAFNLNCVSFATGATGIPINICGDKLIIIDDNDWSAFAHGIISAGAITSNIPDDFFNHFSYEKILQKLLAIL